MDATGIPSKRRHNVRSIAVASIGILTGIGIIAGIGFLTPCPPPPQGPRTLINDESTPNVSPIALADIRAAAWAKIQPRLQEMDQATLHELDAALASIDEFFAVGKSGTRSFAQVVLSMKGKWAFLKAYVPGTDPDGHFKYLNESFEKYVFKPADLKAVVESSVTRYVSRIQGLENELLVNIRADLSEEAKLLPQAIPAIRSDDILRAEYQNVIKRVASDVGSDVELGVAREIVVFVASEVAAQVTLRIGVAVATQLGRTGGIIGGGAALSWETFGVGLVAAVVLDIAVDWLLKIAGYDPEGKVADKVNDTLIKVKATIFDGDSNAREAHHQLRKMQTSDPDATVRKACADAAESIERSGNLGLRRELTKLNEGRTKIRNEALNKLIHEGAYE